MKRSFKGSYTVEAAFVLPVVLMVIFALTYLGFSLHDEACIKGIVETGLREAAEHTRHICMDGENGHEIMYKNINKKLENKEIEGQAERFLKENLTKNLFITRVEAVKASVGLMYIKASYNQISKISPADIFRYFRIRKKQRAESIIIYNPMKTVRMIGGFSEDEGGI